MEMIIYRKTLDLHKSGVQFTLQGFQTADKMARRLEISLMASGDTIDIPLEQVEAIMYVTTPNAAEPSINECTIKDNTIVCDVLPIVEEGITEVQIKLIETGLEGASGVLATPKFAIEVSESNTNEEGAIQSPTYTALENAIAKANGVYDARLIRIELDSDCMFRAIFADGTVYESDVLKKTVLEGEALLSQSFARGGTGLRVGEDTDNSLYYSQLSKNASTEANRISGEAAKLLQEVTKHGVYTAFSVNFKNGELEYVSPMYKFDIDEETGDLVAIGETYSFEETVDFLTNQYIDKCDENFASLNSSVNAIKDFIVDQNELVMQQTLESGEVSSINWTYRKWNNGMVELWGSAAIETNVSMEKQSEGHWHGESFPKYDYPFELKNLNGSIHIQFSLGWANVHHLDYCLVGNCNDINLRTPRYRPYCATQVPGTSSITGRYYVVGRWK